MLLGVLWLFSFWAFIECEQQEEISHWRHLIWFVRLWFVWWCNISFRMYFLLSKNSVQIKATAAYTYESNAKNSFCPYIPTFHFHHSKFCWLLAPATSPKLPASSFHLMALNLQTASDLEMEICSRRVIFIQQLQRQYLFLSNARELNAQNLKNNYYIQSEPAFF